jgi:hypothetical protein
MAGLVCDVCGTENAPGTNFCVSCHSYLAWDEASRSQLSAPDAGSRTELRPGPKQGSETGSPRTSGSGGEGQAARTDAASQRNQPQVASTEDAEDRFQITTEENAATVAATGEPATLAVHVINTSTIVDGYVAEAVYPPAWLKVESSQVQLLPGTSDALSVSLRVVSETLVPAQQVQLVLRIRTLSTDPVHQDLPVLVTVPVIDAPVRLQPQPRMLRVRDKEAAEFTLTVDNSSANRPVRLRFSGSDPELAVRFRFEPPVLQIGPGGSGSVKVAVNATRPDPGQEISRALTVSALDGTRSVDTVITFQQATSARVESPPVTLEVEPSLLRVRDTTVGMVRVLVDNRAGTEWAQLQLRANDPERVVRVTWASPQIAVGPGRAMYADARLEAPLPEAGSEVSRTVTLSATDGRRRNSTATVTYVQIASASPMATLALRIEPSIVRVLDADGATVQVMVDNRNGQTGIRVYLEGSDPERAIGFVFSPPVVDVPAGQVRPVVAQLNSWRPPPGQDWTRQFTIKASDGHSSVEGSGSLAQASSRAAIELLSLRLDPTVLRLEHHRRGRLSVVIDNRNGAQPVRVSVGGDDPENVIRFKFKPNVVDVPPGMVARTTVSVRSPRPPGGQEATRSFAILATDGRQEVRADGSLIQSAGDPRPVARALFTLLGAAAMILGAFGPWLLDTGLTGRQLDVNEAVRVFKLPIDLSAIRVGNFIVDVRPFAGFISAGNIEILLAVLMIFGLTGPKGGLTRKMALLGFLVLAAPFVVLILAGSATWPDWGAVLVLGGCIAGYIGGLLVRR